MYNLSIIKATYCPLSEQLHDIALCEQFCDNFFEGCTEARLKQPCVMCPCINQLVDVGMCADACDYYEGDGKDEEFMMCSYVPSIIGHTLRSITND